MMRLVVILTLGLGVCGPILIDAEKVVFVVPRYIRRSSSSSATPGFYNHDGRSYKIRPSKRPSFFGGHYGPNLIKNEPFFHGEKHRVPQGSDEFNQEYFTPQREVNHVIIPHGKGVSHGISFGKGYIPHDELKGGNENYELTNGNGNNVDFVGQDHQGDVKFEDEGFPRFQNEDQGSGTRNTDWSYAPQESGYAASNYDQGTDQEESRLELQDAYQSQGRSSPQKEEFFFPKRMTGEEPRALLEETVSHGVNSHPVNAAPIAAPVIMVERRPTPIILQDTIDMKEYVEKVEAFAKSWPPAAALQGFGWKNQILNPPAGLTIPNYQGFNSWPSSLPRAQGTGSYQVQEDSMEEPNRRSFRTVMI